MVFQNKPLLHLLLFTVFVDFVQQVEWSHTIHAPNITIFIARCSNNRIDNSWPTDIEPWN